MADIYFIGDVNDFPSGNRKRTVSMEIIDFILEKEEI